MGFTAHEQPQPISIWYGNPFHSGFCRNSCLFSALIWASKFNKKHDTFTWYSKQRSRYPSYWKSGQTASDPRIRSRLARSHVRSPPNGSGSVDPKPFGRILVTKGSSIFFWISCEILIFFVQFGCLYQSENGKRTKNMISYKTSDPKSKSSGQTVSDLPNSGELAKRLWNWSGQTVGDLPNAGELKLSV